MLSNLTKEELMIQSTVKDFSRKEILSKAYEIDKTKEFPIKNLKKMAKLGLLGMLVPHKYGGTDTTTIGYVLALSEIAYSCASTAVIMSVHNSIVCESIVNFGTDEQKQKYLPKLVSGENIGAFALTEPEAGSDPLNQETTAEKKGEFYILNGNKRFITSGKNCGILIATAKTSPSLKHKGISAFIIDKNTKGLIVGPTEDKMGLRASDTTDIIFKDCKVHSKNMLGSNGEGFQVAMTALDRGRIGIAAQSIGVAQAALDAAINYSKKRKQFNRTISSYQGIRWMIADMATQLEAAKQLTFSVAAMKDRGEKYTKEASIAKLFSSEMVNMITSKALQIHGGYGFIADYPVERFYRDARVFTIYEGTSEIQRIIISNNILKDKKKNKI